MLVAVILTADMHPVVTITETTILKFNITTEEETPLFNKVQMY